MLTFCGGAAVMYLTSHKEVQDLLEGKLEIEQYDDLCCKGPFDDDPDATACDCWQIFHCTEALISGAYPFDF